MLGKQFLLNFRLILQKSIFMSKLNGILQIHIENKAYYLKTKLLSIKIYEEEDQNLLYRKFEKILSSTVGNRILRLSVDNFRTGSHHTCVRNG